MVGPSRRAPVDYLIVGHLSRDETPGGARLGGTAAFAGLTAAAFGVRVGVVTSAAEELDLSPLRGLRLHVIDSPESTSFVNEYIDGKREQRLHGRALDLDLDCVPEAWRGARWVHLAPIADEIDPGLAGAFPDSTLLLTPQGWLRRWSADGKVSRKDADDVFRSLPNGDICILSEEDINGERSWIKRLAGRYPLFVLTAGEDGARVFQEGTPTHVPAPHEEQIDPTGAGDIFAPSFVIRYDETADPIKAAHFANKLASRSVGRVGLESVPTSEEIQAARANS